MNKLFIIFLITSFTLTSCNNITEKYSSHSILKVFTDEKT